MSQGTVAAQPLLKPQVPRRWKTGSAWSFSSWLDYGVIPARLHWSLRRNNPADIDDTVHLCWLTLRSWTLKGSGSPAMQPRLVA